MCPVVPGDISFTVRLSCAPAVYSCESGLQNCHSVPPDNAETLFGYTTNTYKLQSFLLYDKLLYIYEILKYRCMTESGPHLSVISACRTG